ncbi:cytochrome c peroxidase [Rhodanobacter sp. L36]|uniref:cytochrome-c peroxidase n=1 Tax=Rhodanobacter sp. L36 TaxID=1747221 RepID=UPI0020B1121E|nr:cytochrome c peroxidase [Rhodanobacter sp. L36]
MPFAVCSTRHTASRSWIHRLKFAPVFTVLCVMGFTANRNAVAQTAIATAAPDGSNPHSVSLNVPSTQPLSAVAQLGRQLFFDTSLSASHKQSCASCHSPNRAYNPPNDLVVQPGGRDLKNFGNRPPPSLTYLYRQQPFSIGPDTGPDDVPVNLNAVAASTSGDPRAQKTAGTTQATAMVPQGGLFWDGRADSLQRQAFLPALDPMEMANDSVATIAHALDRADYRSTFLQLFGPTIFNDTDRLVSEAMFALVRYQIEDPSFHAFSSKYDAWLQGNAKLSATEARGMQLFNDPQKGNCAACHLSQPSRDGLPPLFTDTQYEALGVPRNPHLPANKNPAFHDLGLCGPIRKDLAQQTQYCGMFLTPTLRNVDRRSVFFHNGVYTTLKQVLDFYNLRSVQPDEIYPRDADGKLALYDDIPKPLQGNVDVKDFPLNLKPGDKPALTDLDIRDIIAFLHTLDDGYAQKTPQSSGTTANNAKASAER